MKEDTSSRPLWHTSAGRFSIVTAFGIAAYASWIFSGGFYNSRVDEIVSRLGLTALYLGLSILGFYLTLRRDLYPTLRHAWLALGLGAVSKCAGYLFTLYAITVHQVRAFPGLGDIFFSLYYPLTITGLLLFIFAYVPRPDRALLGLDLVILSSFFGILIWYFFLASPVFFTHGYMDRVLALVYPTGDFLILAGSLSLMQLDLSRATRWIISFFAIGMLFAAAGDLLFAYYEINEILYIPAYLTVFWMSAAQLQLLAAARQITSGAGILTDPPARFNRFRYLFRLALPYLAVIAGLAFLAVVISNRLASESRLTGLLVGAYALVGFVLLRQYIVLEENARLYQKMRHVAWTDSLTGVYNRHFFNEMLPREMDRAARYEKQLAILLLDIDGFKRYNDTYGHLQGDMVLKAVARTFARQLRASDIIARFGGDEFVVILPETNRRMARLIADRIRRTVANQPEARTPLGVSIGVGVFRPGISPEQLIDEADQALYRDKHYRKQLAEGKAASRREASEEKEPHEPFSAAPVTGLAQPAPSSERISPAVTGHDEAVREAQAFYALQTSESDWESQPQPGKGELRWPKRRHEVASMQLALPLLESRDDSPASAAGMEEDEAVIATAKTAPLRLPKDRKGNEPRGTPVEAPPRVEVEEQVAPTATESASTGDVGVSATPAEPERAATVEQSEVAASPTTPPVEIQTPLDEANELAEGEPIPAPEIAIKAKKQVPSEAEAH